MGAAYPAAGVLVCSLAVSAGVRADRGEWRAGVEGVGQVSTIAAGEAEGSGFGFGGRLRIAYGLLDPLELAVLAGFVHAQSIEVPGATLVMQRGRFFTAVDAMDLAVELRWILGVELWRRFARTQPFIAVRGGGLVRHFSGQLLLNDKDMVVERPDDTFDVLPFVGGIVGVQHRFGDHFTVGLAGEVALADGDRRYGGGVMCEWSWY